MEKAYDLSDLANKLKARGLDVAEEAAKIIIEESCAWFQESAMLSATPYDNMAVLVLPQIKALALGAADKIDGQVG